LGIDLTQPLSERQLGEVKQALADHMVIFFRDQKIDFEAHKRFARYFGDILIASSTLKWTMPGHPEITAIHADENSKYVAGEDWHSDMSCEPIPPMGSILYLHTVPETGGDTVFSSMYAAYDALSERMKAYLEGLTALHDAVVGFGGITGPETTLPRASHPVIRTHPVTGRKAIYVNRGFTVKIEDVPAKESAAILAFLYDHIQKPEYQCRFRWQPHSIAFWDNRCLQHSAIWDYFPKTRSGYRVQVTGEKPV
jgi:taurine dioxygenase